MIRRLLLAAAFVTVVAWLLSRRALDVVEVEGRSMAPAFQPGDRLLVESIAFRSRVPREGEVVLARDPRLASRELIKRVVSVDPLAGAAILGGDASEASTDSRTFGAIPVAEIHWRVVARYWPLSRASLRISEAGLAVAEDRDAVDTGPQLRREHVNV